MISAWATVPPARQQGVLLETECVAEPIDGRARIAVLQAGMMQMSAFAVMVEVPIGSSDRIVRAGRKRVLEGCNPGMSAARGQFFARA